MKFDAKRISAINAARPSEKANSKDYIYVTMATERWENSRSKSILRTGLLSGEIRDDMYPRHVFAMDDEHKKWNYDNWASNFRTLKNAVRRDQSRMVRDTRAYGKDLEVIKGLRQADPVPWHLGPCPELLKKDVDDGKHIYQEIDSRPKRALRFEKKKKTWKYPEHHKNHPRLRQNNET